MGSVIVLSWYHVLDLAILSPINATAPAAKTPPTAAAPPNTPRPISPSRQGIVRSTLQHYYNEVIQHMTMYIHTNNTAHSRLCQKILAY